MFLTLVTLSLFLSLKLERTKGGWPQETDFPVFSFLHQGLNICLTCTSSQPTGWLHLCSNHTQAYSSSTVPGKPGLQGQSLILIHLDTANVHTLGYPSLSPEVVPSGRITYFKALDYETTCWHSCLCYYTTSLCHKSSSVD